MHTLDSEVDVSRADESVEVLGQRSANSSWWPTVLDNDDKNMSRGNLPADCPHPNLSLDRRSLTHAELPRRLIALQPTRDEHFEGVRRSIGGERLKVATDQLSILWREQVYSRGARIYDPLGGHLQDQSRQRVKADDFKHTVRLIGQLGTRARVLRDHHVCCTRHPMNFTQHRRLIEAAERRKVETSRRPGQSSIR